MSIINLNEQKETYLTNALGEETGDKEIAENIYEWYENTCVDNEWLPNCRPRKPSGLSVG